MQRRLFILLVTIWIHSWSWSLRREFSWKISNKRRLEQWLQMQWPCYFGYRWVSVMHAKFHRGGFRSFESGSRFVSESQFCKYAYYSYLLSLGIVKNIYSHICWNPAHWFYTYSLILLKPPHGYTRTKMWVIGWSSLRVQRALLPRKHFTNVLFNKNFQPAGFAPAVPENGENIDESSTCLLR